MQGRVVRIEEGHPFEIVYPCGQGTLIEKSIPNPPVSIVCNVRPYFSSFVICVRLSFAFVYRCLSFSHL